MKYFAIYEYMKTGMTCMKQSIISKGVGVFFRGKMIKTIKQKQRNEVLLRSCRFHQVSQEPWTSPHCADGGAL